MAGRKNYQVAIDGPVGSGKSSAARLIADRLGWLYVYTGAMYRAAALLAKDKGIDWNSREKVAALIKSATMEMRKPTSSEKDGRVVTFFLNGKDVSNLIMKEEISKGASLVAVHREVREELVKKQQEIASKQDVVMEGRDITFRVLPQAQLKIYLTADEKERARRRFKQLKERGEKVNFKDILEELRQRDRRDSSREIDPLQISKDVWIMDTTGFSLNEVAEKIIQKIKEEN